MSMGHALDSISRRIALLACDTIGLATYCDASVEAVSISYDMNLVRGYDVKLGFNTDLFPSRNPRIL